MMILDWIFFDTKGKFRPYDPLWRATMPMLYYAVFSLHKSFFVLYPSLGLYSGEMFFLGGILGLLVVSYGLDLLDIGLRHR